MYFFFDIVKIFFFKCFNDTFWSSIVFINSFIVFLVLLLPGSIAAQTCKTPSLGATTVGETQSCDPINFGYILNNYADNDTITQYDIDFGDGVEITLHHNELNPSGTDTIYHSYASTSCHIYDKAFTFRIVAGANCAVFAKTISIYPVVIGEPPKPNFDFPNPGCMGESIHFINNTEDGFNFDCLTAAEYTLDFGDGTVVHSSAKNSQSHIYTAPGEYAINLDVEQDCGVQNIQKTITIVGPTVSAFEIGESGNTVSIDDCADPPVVYNPASICVPVTVPVTSVSTGEGLIETWRISPATGATFSTGSDTSRNSTEVITFNAPGTYHITLTTENVCGEDVSCVDVIVDDVPVAEEVRIEGIPDSYCSPATLDVHTNVQDAVSYQWSVTGIGTDDPVPPENADTWDPGPVVLNGGTYEMTLELANTCGNITIVDTIRVVPPFSAEIQENNVEICEGGTSVVRAVHVEDASYQWQFNDADIPDAIADSVEISQNGNYSVVITREQCSITSSSIPASLRPLPPAVITPPTQTAFCEGEPVVVLFEANRGEDLIYQWYKDGQNITGADSDTISVTEIGDYYVEVSDSVCNNTSDVVSITIGRTPLTDFNFDSVQCQGQEVNFVNITPDIPGETISYHWNFGDSSQVVDTRDASYIFDNPRSYDITLQGVIESSGCELSVTKAISIITAPEARFSATYDPEDLCGPVTVDFENLSSGDSLSFLWDFGNGETSDLFERSGVILEAGITKDTSYIVSLQAYSAVSTCPSSEFRDTIFVNASPKAQFLFATDTICADYPLEINNYSIGVPDIYTWSFGDGTGGLSTEFFGTITHSFPYEGRRDTVYYVSLTGANICGSDTIVRPLVVTSNIVEAFFNIDRSSGCAPLNVNFTSNQLGYNSITWLWGDTTDNSSTGGIEQSYTYNDPGTFEARLVVQNGCNVDTFSQAVTVYELPQVSFEGPDAVCVGQEANFVNTSPNKAGSEWLFEGTKYPAYPGSDPSYRVYDSTGIFNVSLTITDPVTSCQNSTSQSIEVLNIPVANFQIPEDFCAGDTLRVINNSIYADRYYWDFGQTGGLISGASPFYVFSESGLFSISMTAQNDIGCENVMLKTINIQRQPEPLFEVSFTDSTRKSPVGAVVTNQTTFPSEKEGTFVWDLDLDRIEDGYDVTYTIPFVNNGDVVKYYTISLKAVTDVGCTATYSRTFSVGSSDCDDRIAVPNVFTPNGDGLNDVLRPLIRNGENTYRPVVEADGLENYRMQIYNRWGELVFQSSNASEGWDGNGFSEDIYYCTVQFKCKSFSSGKLNSIEVLLKH